MEQRKMLPEEKLYCYNNSSQIAGQTGLVGFLRGTLESSGNSFFSTWYGCANHLKTDAFKTEFDKVINTLRDKGGFLENRKALANFCYLENALELDDGCYGWRINTKDFAYLFWLNPAKSGYNVSVYAYKKDWLDEHIENSRKGIRFITPDYNELFRIPDGGSIMIADKDGLTRYAVCRYIDDYHVEVDNFIYHICEYAEKLQAAGSVATLKPEMKISKKANMAYWDEIEDVTEKYIKEMLIFGDVKSFDEDDLLDATKEIVETVTKYLKTRYKAKYPFVNENY